MKALATRCARVEQRRWGVRQLVHPKNVCSGVLARSGAASTTVKFNGNTVEHRRMFQIALLKGTPDVTGNLEAKRRVGVITRGLSVVLVAFALVLGAATSGAGAGSQPLVPPGQYTYDQAVALGIVDPDEFIPPLGMPTCPTANAAKAAIPAGAPAPPHDAPICFSNPADIEKIIVGVPAPGSPSFAPEMTISSSSSAPSLAGFRFFGSQDEAFSYSGGSMLTEVSDPSVCQSFCVLEQHFYNRTSARTSAGNSIQVGWGEANHAPADTGNDQMVLTVTAQGDAEQVMLHSAWALVPGSQYAFRNQHCGFPGELLVCMEIWNGSSWTVLRQWEGVMRCLNANGTFNCNARFWDEAFTQDDATWFDLNGGSDGLRTQNIEIKRDWWDLLGSTAEYSPIDRGWSEQAPYSICRLFAYYHFTAFRGPPSC
ncbi:MAG: hypothetical protein WKF65_08485 [Gaiellaceae bacterium]